MKNYQVGNPTPEAFITKNKLRVKQLNGTIFLQDGDNFEIELFNPTSNKVLAKISLDGNRISSSGIIIKPGQRIYLERYIDTNNKFIYSTYEVNGNNKEVQQAIKSNGDLKVEFFDQQQAPAITYAYPSYWGGTITPCNGVYYQSTITTATPIVYGTLTTSASGTYSASATQFTNCCANTLSTPGQKIKKSLDRKIETGTVEKGEASNQDFKYSYDNFNNYTMNVVTWKIMPLSQKPITSDEIKVFCVSCGTRKRKQTHTFCPNCGTKFE